MSHDMRIRSYTRPSISPRIVATFFPPTFRNDTSIHTSALSAPPMPIQTRFCHAYTVTSMFYFFVSPFLLVFVFFRLLSFLLVSSFVFFCLLCVCVCVCVCLLLSWSVCICFLCLFSVCERSFVRAAVRPCERSSVRPCVRPCLCVRVSVRPRLHFSSKEKKNQKKIQKLTKDNCRSSCRSRKRKLERKREREREREREVGWRTSLYGAEQLCAGWRPWRWRWWCCNSK